MAKRRSRVTDLPDGVLEMIIAKGEEEFIFILAVRGVCRQWRACCKRRPFSYLETKREKCRRHGRFFDCGCRWNSVQRVMSSCDEVRRLTLPRKGRLVKWLTKMPGVAATLKEVNLECKNGGYNAIFCSLLDCPNLEKLEMQMEGGVLVVRPGDTRDRSFQRLKHLSLSCLEDTPYLDVSGILTMCPLAEYVCIARPGAVMDWVYVTLEHLRILHLWVPAGSINVRAPKLREATFAGGCVYRPRGSVVIEGGSLDKIVMDFTRFSRLRLEDGARVDFLSIKEHGFEYIEETPRVRRLRLSPLRGAAQVFPDRMDFSQVEELEVNIVFVMTEMRGKDTGVCMPAFSRLKTLVVDFLKRLADKERVVKCFREFVEEWKYR